MRPERRHGRHGRHGRRGHLVPARAAVPAAVAAIAVLVAGCATMPTTGPVQAGRSDYRPQADGRPVEVSVPPPQPGWSPDQVVSGFLAAMESSDLGTARQYLVGGLRKRWPVPGEPSVVYANDGSFNVQPDRDNTANLTANQVGTISSRGEYRPARRAQQVHAQFRLQRVRGQWRIASLPGGRLLSSQDAIQYQPFQLYYLARDRDVLVPEPVVLRQDDESDSAHQLVDLLLSDPPSGLGDAVRTAVPRGTRLVGAPMQDGRGVLTIRLSEAAARASAAERSAMIAQITATMMQIYGVTRVRVAIGENEVTTARGLQAAEAYQPTGQVHDRYGYFLRDGRLVRVDPGNPSDVSALRGPYGAHRRTLSRPAVSLDGERIASLAAGGRSLTTAPVDASGDVRTVYEGASLSAPSWDRAGDLWVVENAAKGPRLLLFPDGRGPAVPVAADLGSHRVSEVRVAWDGVQVALVVPDADGEELQLGYLDRSGKVPRLVGVHGIAPSLYGVSHVWWYGPSGLSVVASSLITNNSVDVYTVTSDGLSVQRAIVGVDGVTNLAGAIGRSLLVADAHGQIQSTTVSAYDPHPIGTGSTPVYPG